MDYSQLEDEALLRLISRNHADALSELYDRYSRLVYSIALHILVEQAKAEEITLHVFRQVWQTADTYRSDHGTVRVWLTSITRKRTLDGLRQRGVRLDAQRKFGAEVTSQAISRERVPETDGDLDVRGKRIRTAVMQLPEEQQVVLELAYFQGCSENEIAELCNLSPDTVKSRIRLAMRQLRKLL